MPAEAVSLTLGGAVETRPAAHARLRAVGADNPTRPDRVEGADRRAPKQTDPEILRARHERLMQRCPSHAHSAALRERRIRRRPAVVEPDPPQRKPMHPNTQRTGGLDPV